AGRFGACADALEQALRHARSAGSRAEELSLLARLPASTYLGAIPAAEAIRRCELVREQAGDNLEVRTVGLRYLGALHALPGASAEARRLLEGAKAIRQELGFMVGVASGALVSGDVELL